MKMRVTFVICTNMLIVLRKFIPGTGRPATLSPSAFSPVGDTSSSGTASNFKEGTLALKH